ncbi:MAG: protein arginine kinase [candidate division Zixibacteria bacterium]|nr:protein arginine kinase [candidate division Zixibacteria bacterium]
MFEDMSKKLTHWLSGKGKESMVVLSTRVRLARNISGCIYPSAADTDTKEKVVGYFESAFGHSEKLREGKFLKASELSRLDRDFLVERHLMSPTFMQDNDLCALYVSRDEQVSIMVNEEDHFRIQAITPGLNPEGALQLAGEYDNEVGGFLEFDYDPDFGFLTACPTNVGTGMRASVLIHLPGLVITKDIEKVISKISKMGVVVRGFYGEGTDVLGNLFQLSNQTTLGVSEREILELITGVTRSIIEDEATARQRLISEASHQIIDKIWRAYGILKYARILTSEEVMNLLSAVRLGTAMGIIDYIEISLLNEILLLSQPAHLQKYFSKEMNAEQRDIVRAEMVREKLKEKRSLN